MEKFTVLNGLVAPLDRANVDTDQIIPKQYLTSIKRTGFAEGLFGAWRGDPQFVLNQPRYKAATILLARKDFRAFLLVDRAKPIVNVRRGWPPLWYRTREIGLESSLALVEVLARE